MTEPPRPPGEGNPHDPTAPFNPYAANDPSSGSTPPPPPPYGAPSSGGPGYGAPPPTSGGGYGAPPPTSGGGYGTPPPQYGYQQQPPQGYGPGPGYGGGQTADDKTWIQIAHFGGALGAFVGGGLGGWIVPLIAMMAKGQQSPAVRAEAVKALNFQIVWSIVGIIGWATTCIAIGFAIFPIAALIAIIFGVIAGVKATNGEPYNYPMTINLIK
ncbi:DUF4870 domain-containing protein [Actinoplanes bogorensis]|uniref:DUF4870 domain-containing protein n=1 Tax=Paractinoplanes bogorensis TaxID=1610840 RepID=A0ABS5Z5N0_9ACTN|nr:DUF4870 domain-containing protein [Actinoplanes bogorensis]MBU2669750.1 DUF4870 domain-containing protein [Actinoplanes bogorensis]